MTADKCIIHGTPLMLADDGVAWRFLFCPDCKVEGRYRQPRRESRVRAFFRAKLPRNNRSS